MKSRSAIRQKLKGKSARQRARIKSEEIAKLPVSGSFTRHRLRVEIRSMNLIEGGVEVFARAWKNGRQIGFGADGTVEIERFRIFNPPLLVDDPEGDIVQEWTDDKGQIHTRALREDPLQALKETLFHTIRVVGKEGSAIRMGKIGNTTSTFYSDAGGDGYTEGSNASYATARSTGTTSDSAGTIATVNNQFRNIDGKYYVQKGFITYGTSALPDTDAISSAVVSLYGFGKTDTLGVNPGFSIVDSTQASDTALATSDHPNVGSTVYASLAYSALSTSGYNDWTLDASGIAQVNKTGYSKFAIRNANEIANTPPATGGNHLQQFLYYSADETGTTKDPKLVIVHAAPVFEAEVTPVLLELAIPDVTATFDIVGTAEVTPVELELSIPDVTANNIATASVTPVELELTIPDVTASGGESAEVTPVLLELTIPDVTAESQQVETASVEPVALEVTIPDVTANNVATAEVTPVLLELSVPEVTAKDVGIASVEPVELELTIPDVAATAQFTAEVTPVLLELTIPDVSAGSTAVAQVTPVLLELTVPDVTATGEFPPIPEPTSSGGFPYALDLHSSDGVLETLQTPIINVTGWSKRINAPGKLVFRINKHHADATDENLQMWRNVTLYRRPRTGGSTMVPEWYGVILAKREVGEYIEVLCAGALKILSKRFTSVAESFTGEGSEEAFDLLTAANLTGPTGITEGVGGIETTLNLTLNNVDMLHALEEIHAAVGGEFEVDEFGSLNSVPSLGTDKSEIIELIFRRDGQQSNLIEFEIAEDGEPMANVILGTSSADGGLSSTYTHPTSSDTYPVLVERKAFNQAQDQGTLDALTEAYGLQRAFPITDFRVVPATATKKFNPITGERELSGLQLEDVSVGDLVLVTVITENRNQSSVKRIAEIVVDVDENLREQIRFTLTEAGVFVTESYLFDSNLPEIKRRIQEIEQSL